MWGYVVLVNHAVTEREKCRKGVAWQSRQEKVDGDTPARRCCQVRPRLHDRPPEEQAGGKKARVFHLVPDRRPKGQFEESRYMPSYDSSCSNKPAKPRIGHPAA